MNKQKDSRFVNSTWTHIWVKTLYILTCNSNGMGIHVFCWFRGGVVGIPSKGSQATTSMDPRYLGLGMVIHVNQTSHKPQFQPQLWVGEWIVCHSNMWKYFMLFWSTTYCYQDLQVWKEATQLMVKFILINLCNILHIHELSCDITKELGRVV